MSNVPCHYPFLSQVMLHGMDEGIIAKLCRGILAFAIACSTADATKVCRRIDKRVMKVASAPTLNSNVEIGERSGFKLFKHGVTEYLLKSRRIDGGWYISILRHLHVVLCTTTDFFRPRERELVAQACNQCIKVHAALRLPLLKVNIGNYEADIDRLLELAVEVCAPSTPSGCASIKFHWPRHWTQTRLDLGCSAQEKSLERKLGEAHKRNYAYTNKNVDMKDEQMDRADHRLNQLRDLLHHVKKPPMTEIDGESDLVTAEPTQVKRPTLVNKAMMKPFKQRGSYKQLPASMGKKAALVCMAKVAVSEYLKPCPPLVIGQQLSMTLRNRQLPSDDPQHLVRVTLRAVPKLYGKPRYDNVKVVLDAEEGKQRMFFGR